MSQEGELIRNARRLRSLLEDQQKGEGVLALLPQGPGSGLDADMVDGLHAVDIIEECIEAIRRADLLLRTASGSGGGTGSGSGMVKHGNEWHTSTFAQACCQICVVDALPDVEAAGYMVLLSLDQHLYLEIEGTENACGCKFPVVDVLPDLDVGEAVFLSTDKHLYVEV